MRKTIVKILFFVDGALRFAQKVNGVLVRNLKRDITTVHGYKMFLDRRDSLGLSLREFEPEIVKIFKEYIKPGDTVLDIGANIGYHTLLASKLGAKVYAFEPEPETFKLLQKNVEYNNCVAVLINKAVSDKNGTVTLYINPDNNGGHSLEYKHEKSVEVEAVALDEYFPDLKPDFIKMDIEGAEYHALLGMKRMLNDMNVKMVVEYAGIQEKYGTADFLKSCGFKLYKITLKGLVPFSPEAHERSINLLCIK